MCRTVLPVGGTRAPIHLWRNVHEATLQDLSLAGLGVIVAPETELAVANTRVIEIDFGPPAFAEPFTMPAKIRHRVSVVAGVRYGLELVQDHSSQFVENTTPPQWRVIGQLEVFLFHVQPHDEPA